MRSGGNRDVIGEHDVAQHLGADRRAVGALDELSRVEAELTYEWYRLAGSDTVLVFESVVDEAKELLSSVHAQHRLRHARGGHRAFVIRERNMLDDDAQARLAEWAA